VSTDITVAPGVCVVTVKQACDLADCTAIIMKNKKGNSFFMKLVLSFNTMINNWNDTKNKKTF
jgi:hypothetical protein